MLKKIFPDINISMQAPPLLSNRSLVLIGLLLLTLGVVVGLGLNHLPKFKRRKRVSFAENEDLCRFEFSTKKKNKKKEPEPVESDESETDEDEEDQDDKEPSASSPPGCGKRWTPL